MKIAAGILFVTTTRQVLLLQRGPDYPDHGGEWDFPGGHVEEGETPLEGAERECREEVGRLPRGSRAEHARRIAEDVDYTTFIQTIDEPFTPKLNEEHVGYTWATIDQYPEPLHPGVRVALDKMGWDETQVARAISSGDLTSPQYFHNMWLFALRISGTGTAFRPKLGEMVFRDPDLYLNPEFLARCNGLPVILEHPAKKMLDSAEFSERIIGTVCLPYIRDDEVWGIARIYDAPAALMMRKNQLSTSPDVVFTDPSVNNMLSIDGKPTLLIEGKPHLLDHLAICPVGVWDKGGEPRGVQNDLIATESRVDGAPSMTKEELEAAIAAASKAAAAEAMVLARADSAEGMAAFTAKLDTMCSRLDAMEARGDAEGDDKDEDEDAKKDADEGDDEEKEEDKPKKVAADSKAKKDAKKDSAKKDDEEESRADARADSASAAILARLDAIDSRLPVDLPPETTAALASAQAAADRVYSAYGDSAPRAMQGEGLLNYRRRLASKFKEHSPDWAGVDLNAIADSATLGIAEKAIFASALAAATRPANIPARTLREVVRQDSTGRRISEFYGHPSAWMNQFKMPRQRARILKQTGRA